MQRFNSFNMIHKALRAMLYDVALTLQQTYFPDAIQAQAALEKVRIVIEQFERHAYHEDTYVLPAVEQYERELVEELEKEHVEDVLLGNRLLSLLNMFNAAESDIEKINCGSGLNKAFRDFMVFNIVHMSKEEIDINRALWKHYTDAELMELNAKITNSIPPEEKMIVSKWMMRAINKAEAITWLKTVKQTAPAFVFEGLLQLAEVELPAHYCTEVIESVLESEMVA